MSALNAYRAYFIDRYNHVCSVAIIEAADVDGACHQAVSLLAGTSYAAVEIWEDSRIVGHRTASKRTGVHWPFARYFRKHT